MQIKAGDVVKVAFTCKSKNQPSTAVGVVEAVDGAQEFATVFVGNMDSWSVSTACLSPLALPASFSWTADDTEKVRSTASAFLTTAVGQSPSSSAPSFLPTRRQLELEASLVDLSKADEAQRLAPSSFHAMGSSSFHGHDSHNFEPNAAYTNVLYEMNARLTGLCTWTSPPLTVLFLTVLYLWLAVEGNGVLIRSGDASPQPGMTVVAQRCAVAVVRTLLAVVLCTCVSMAPRQTPTSTFWFLFPLMVLSFGGLMPVRLWRALVVGSFPIRLPSQVTSSRSDSGTGSRSSSSATAAAAPLILWVGMTATDALRCVLRGLSSAMITTGESLRVVSEKSD
ncbi:hypothetical protein N2W54_002857 [Lotmaria passim]